jgi:hypothetical protein
LLVSTSQDVPGYLHGAQRAAHVRVGSWDVSCCVTRHVDSYIDCMVTIRGCRRKSALHPGAHGKVKLDITRHAQDIKFRGQRGHRIIGLGI